MSFKVYNGGLIKETHTLEEIFVVVEELRKTITKKVHKAKAREIKMLACLIYDKYYVEGVDVLEDKAASRVPLLEASNRILFKTEKNDMNEYVICIGQALNHTVIVPYFPNPECVKLLFEHPKIEMFGYWDSTDPEEDVSEKDWELRGKIWNKIFQNSGVPAEDMMNIRLVDEKHIIPNDSSMKDVPNFEERLTALAQDRAFEKAITKIKEEGKIDSKNNPGTFINEVMKNAKELKGDIKEELKDKLNKNITMKDLEKELPKIIKKD